MLKNKRKTLDNDTICTECNKNCSELSLLPCGKSQCIACISSNKNLNEFKFSFCKTVHQIQINELSSNDSLIKRMNKEIQIKLNKEAEDFKEVLSEIEAKIKQAEFDLSNGDHVISEHCRELKRRVQLAKEIKMQELEKLSDQMLSQIDLYEKDAINDYLQSNKDQNDLKLKEIKDYIAKCNNELIKLDIKDSKYKIEEINSRLKMEQEKINYIIFNQNMLDYTSNTTILNQNIIGKLVSYPFESIKYDHLVQTDLRNHFLDYHIENQDSFTIEKKIWNRADNVGSFLNGDFVIVNGSGKDLLLVVFLFDENKQLIKRKSFDIGLYRSHIASNKIFLDCMDRLDEKMYFCVLNDQLDLISKVENKYGYHFSGANEENIVFMTNNDPTLIICNWLLKYVESIKSDDPFFFDFNSESYIFKIYKLNDKKFFLIYNKRGFQVMDATSGIILRSVDIHIRKLEIDSDNNIIIFDSTAESLKYYDINGNFLKEIKLIGFPKYPKWFLSKNKLNFFDFNRFVLSN